MKIARTLIVLLPVSQEVDAPDASAEAIAASDPCGLEGVADAARERLLALRHELARAAPNASVGAAASILVRGDGTELVALLDALVRAR